MSTNVQEERKNVDELSPGQCPRCRNGGPSGDEWTVSLYWNEGEEVFHCIICGYRQYAPLEGCHTGYLTRKIPEESRSGCKLKSRGIRKRQPRTSPASGLLTLV